MPNGQAFHNVSGWDPEEALIVAEMGWSNEYNIHSMKFAGIHRFKLVLQALVTLNSGRQTVKVVRRIHSLDGRSDFCGERRTGRRLGKAPSAKKRGIIRCSPPWEFRL